MLLLCVELFGSNPGGRSSCENSNSESEVPPNWKSWNPVVQGEIDPPVFNDTGLSKSNRSLSCK